MKPFCAPFCGMLGIFSTLPYHVTFPGLNFRHGFLRLVDTQFASQWDSLLGENRAAFDKVCLPENNFTLEKNYHLLFSPFCRMYANQNFDLPRVDDLGAIMQMITDSKPKPKKE